CDLDHVLVHIDRGHPVMHHLHVPPPEAALRTNREQKAGRPTGPLTSIRRLIHALAAAAGMTRNGDPSTKLFSGLERPKANRWRRTARQPQHAPSTPPPSPPTTANPRADPSPAPISSQASRHEVAHLFLFSE